MTEIFHQMFSLFFHVQFNVKNFLHRNVFCRFFLYRISLQYFYIRSLRMILFYTLLHSYFHSCSLVTFSQIRNCIYAFFMPIYLICHKIQDQILIEIFSIFSIFTCFCIFLFNVGAVFEFLFAFREYFLYGNFQILCKSFEYNFCIMIARKVLFMDKL